MFRSVLLKVAKKKKKKEKKQVEKSGLHVQTAFHHYVWIR